jgi:hypothetical protein
MGAMAVHKDRHARQHMSLQIYHLTVGGMSCMIILNGLRDNSILPTGGGQNGSLLGSSLPTPYSFFSAMSYGIRYKVH